MYLGGDFESVYDLVAVYDLAALCVEEGDDDDDDDKDEDDDGGGGGGGPMCSFTQVLPEGGGGFAGVILGLVIRG
ncbi:hypothetical protein K504DRAFT_460895 [Pleomassaria siparia CBS 279.74]|uniref:Uncharacterized protein n=1 Tax=Pleomassaria siparia CBS 279.74 TaxID=1314801 RepID=A0A6G1JWX6_9PLEO|nr:hypothetical protein K504DRAFT_460895 [Pleomassaria siparia CBS 279.74]